MPYVTLKNGNRIEAVDEFTGLSMAIEANREERKIEVDLGDGEAPVELDGADQVARQAANEAKAQAAEAQASAAANAQAIAQANAEISRVENKEDQAISGVRTDLATIDGKADANAAAVSGLATRVDTAESTIAEHSSAIATNADNINLVEAKATHADAEAERIAKLIPSDATISNNLTTKDFVNSTVATNTATFRGTYNSLAELEAVADADVNDYGFVVQTSGSATVYKRYKYNGSAWVWEYDLNNSSFAAAQWNAINSGADASKVAQIEANRLAIAQLDASKADASDVADLAGDIAQVETDLATKASAGDLATLQTTVQQNTSNIAANTSAINNLATVARTGSYNDLIDKPQEAPIMLNNNFSNVNYWSMNSDSATSSSFPWVATLTEITIERPFDATDTGYNVTVSFDPASAISGKLAGFCTFEVTAGVENTSVVSVKIYATENSVTPSGYVTVMHS